MKTCVLLLVSSLIALSAMAEDTDHAPNFANQRFLEDWSQFDKTQSDVWLKDLKRIPLSDQVWMSVGGSLRVRYEHFENFLFDDPNDDGYLLYRAFLHTDMHFGEHVRIFLEGRFADLNNRDLPGGKREALDFDRGDIWNTFVEFRAPLERVKLSARIGRQELQYGAQRLISPLDWANNRRIFDGAVLQAASPEGNWKLDVFGAWPVNIRGESLYINKRNQDYVFGGAYFTQRIQRTSRPTKWDGYFLIKDQDRGGGAEERRYTLGARLYGQATEKLSYELEGAYQFGHQKSAFARGLRDTDSIRAWMLTAQSTYTFAETRFKPFVTLGFDYASGDSDPNDGRVETFDALFPLGHAFLGFIDLVGRANIVDYRASVGFWPLAARLKVQADYHYFRRASGDDGLYNASGGLMRAPFFTTRNGRVLGVSDKDIGHEVDLTLLYKHNRHLDFLFGYSRFWTGDYLQRTGASDNIHFFYGQAGFTF